MTDDPLAPRLRVSKNFLGRWTVAEVRGAWVYPRASFRTHTEAIAWADRYSRPLW